MNSLNWMGSILAEFRINIHLVTVFDTIMTWIERSSQRRALRQLDDHLLRDLGVSRGAALHEAEKPFWRP